MVKCTICRILEEVYDENYEEMSKSMSDEELMNSVRNTVAIDLAREHTDLLERARKIDNNILKNEINTINNKLETLIKKLNELSSEVRD